MTERHCDAMRPWEAALPRPCLERARDMGRHRRRTRTQQQLADTGQKTLKASVGRAPAFGEPDQRIAGVKNPRRDFQCRAGMAWIDREQMHRPREQPREWAGEQARHIPGPIKLAKPTPRQRCGNCRTVKVSDMVGRNEDWPRVRSLSTPANRSRNRNSPRITNRFNAYITKPNAVRSVPVGAS
jgi:hypothetical protein